MESNEIREQLREAERAAAAPYIFYPKDPWWVFGLLCLILPLVCVALRRLNAPANDVPTLSLFIPSIVIIVITLVVVAEQRKRRGTLPTGKAPREISLVYRGYALGAVLVGLVVIPLGMYAPLTVSIPVAFVLNVLGLLWFGAAYERAAARVRVRLA